MTETTRYFYATARCVLADDSAVTKQIYSRHVDSFSPEDTLSNAASIVTEIIYDMGSDGFDAPVEEITVKEVRLISESEYWRAPKDQAY